MPTLTVYGSTNDGLIFGFSTDYNTARNTANTVNSTGESMTVGQTFEGGTYGVYNVYLKFPSSDISAAVYDRTAYARLALSVYSLGYNGSTSNFDVDIIKQDWSAHDPLVSTDIETPYDDCFTDTKDVSWHEFTSSTAAGNTTFYSPPLDLDWISPTTDNYYSLRSNRANDSTAPGGVETVVISTVESTDTSYHPQLQLIYLEPSGDAIDYFLGIDWAGDGVYGDVNEADYMVKWSSSRGRRKIFRPSGRGFQPYEIGKLTITLDNSNGRYDPWNTEGPLYGDLMPGRNMTFKVSYCSTSASGYSTESVFTGTVTDIQVKGHNKTVNLVCEDGWRFLSDWQYQIMPYTSGSGGVVGELNYILIRTLAFTPPSTYSFPLTNKYPWGVAYSTDNSSTDLPRHWWWDGSAKKGVEMMTFGSLGRAWIKKDGQFDFGDFRETTDSAVLAIDEDVTLKSIYLPTPWENLRSEIVIKGTNNVIYSPATITSLIDPIKVDAGETVEFSLRYSYESITNLYCPRITGITLAGFENSNGTGTDISGDITYTVTIYNHSIEVEATNGGATNGYITTFDVSGEPLEVTDTIRSYETTSAYRDASFVLKSPWLSITSIGTTSGEIEETTTTLDDKARVNTVGETLKSYLSTVKAYPVIQLNNRFTEQFTPELEDKITLTAGTLGIDDDYRISRIEHKSLGTPQDILTTFWLYPVMTPVETT